MEEVNPYEPPNPKSYEDDKADDLYDIACLASQGMPYPPEAFVFLVQGLHFATGHIQHSMERSGHIDAIDVCWCLHDFAVYRFAEDARSQLASWNVHSTRDFGELVYRLIHLGHLLQNEGESVNDFDDVFDFSDQFRVREFQSTLLIDEDN